MKLYVLSKVNEFHNHKGGVMKKNALMLVLTLLSLNCCPLAAQFDASLEIRSSAFFHVSDRFREIYGNVDPSYQVEASTPIYECMDVWANFDWFSAKGRSEGLRNPTRVSIANIGVGVKFPYQFCECFTAYAGIGPSLSRIWLKNKSSCVHERTSKLAFGGLLKTGVYYFITSCVFLDVFVDYLYQPVHFETHVDIGGLKVGGGIGMKF